VSGTLANSGTGTVTVNNLGPALAPGDTFTLFNKAVTGGNALTITGGQTVWNNNLAVERNHLRCHAHRDHTRTAQSYSLSGNSLTLSWPPNYLTWTFAIQHRGRGFERELVPSAKLRQHHAVCRHGESGAEQTRFIA